MRRAAKAISRVLFWTYTRGSWQYDILCLVILAFIFLTPRDYFVKPPFVKQQPKKIEQKNSSQEAGRLTRVQEGEANSSAKSPSDD